MEWTMTDWCTFVSGPFKVEIYPGEPSRDCYDMQVNLRGMVGDWKRLAERLKKEIDGTPSSFEKLIAAIGKGDEGAIRRLCYNDAEIMAVLEFGYQNRNTEDKKKIDKLEDTIDLALRIADYYSEVDPAFQRIASILNG